jgi:hypothetical protein
MIPSLPGIHYFPEADSDEQIDRLYRAVDGMFDAGQFDEVERLLDIVDVTRLSITLALGYLTITLMPLGVKNPARQRFAQRFRMHLDTIEPADRVDRLLQGLE